jgi:hypothetical protein
VVRRSFLGGQILLSVRSLIRLNSDAKLASFLRLRALALFPCQAHPLSASHSRGLNFCYARCKTEVLSRFLSSHRQFSCIPLFPGSSNKRRSTQLDRRSKCECLAMCNENLLLTVLGFETTGQAVQWPATPLRNSAPQVAPNKWPSH